LCIDPESFEEEDAYEYLLEEFVEATNGKWQVTDIALEFDEDTSKCKLSFNEAGNPKAWTFTHRTGELNSVVYNSIVTRIEQQTAEEIQKAA